MVETFFKTLKSELVWRTVFLTRAQAQAAIGYYMIASITPSDATRHGIRQPGHVRKTGRPVSPTALHFARQIQPLRGKFRTTHLLSCIQPPKRLRLS